MLIEPDNAQISISRQCELLNLARSSFYYQPVEPDSYDLLLKRMIDEEYTRAPFYGSRRMSAWLNQQGHEVNRKRVQRLMREMAIEAIYPRPRLSKPAPGHHIYPYLLRELKIDHPNLVWSVDITYVRMLAGFIYLVAVIDWYSRYILSWEISNSLDSDFCLRALDTALLNGTPDIFNSDQGSQFTSRSFTDRLQDSGIKISMDGRGRAFDNIFIERFWRTIKYEEVYIKDYQTVDEATESLGRYIEFYNNERLHQSLGYNTPGFVHHQKAA